jgi:hypothetical protein
MAYIEDVVIVNKNHCRSHGLALTTALTNLTGGHACSEMYIVNKTGNPVIVYDNAFVAADQGFLLDDNDSVTVRGITSTNSVSAKTTAGTGVLYYRTQYYSMSLQNG